MKEKGTNGWRERVEVGWGDRLSGNEKYADDCTHNNNNNSYYL